MLLFHDLLRGESYFTDSVEIAQQNSILWQFKPGGDDYYRKIRTGEVTLSIAAKIPFTLSSFYEKPYITIFIDKSGSMKEGFLRLQNFFPELLTSLPDCYLKLILFDRLSQATEFQENSKVNFDLSKVKPGGSTRLWDLLYFEAKKQQNLLSPKFFIVLSDGNDQAVLNSPRPYSQFKVEDVISGMNKINCKAILRSFGHDPDRAPLKTIADSTAGIYQEQCSPQEIGDFLRQNLEFFYALRYQDPYQKLSSGKTRNICLSGNYKQKFQISTYKDFQTDRGFLQPIPGRKSDAFSLFISKISTADFPETIIYFQAYYQGQNVLDMQSGDFEFYLKTDADLFRWENPEIPVSLGIFIDTSGSLANEEQLSKTILSQVQSTIQSNVSAEIFTLSESYPFFEKNTQEKLEERSYSGPTPLYDALFNLSMHLNADNQRSRLLVITDGWDEFYEGSHNRFSKKKAVELINLGYSACVKFYTCPIGKDPNLRTLRLIAEGTNGDFFPLGTVPVETLCKPEIFRYFLRFENPFFATEIPAYVDIKIRNVCFNFYFQGVEWQLTPLPLSEQAR
ncbi:MAG: VWA domain-containing protein [Candidatus Wallbacteria bacterium]|nr:VWA domain-containing protein [Candidatus Wallbacteria bacterium]